MFAFLHFNSSVFRSILPTKAFIYNIRNGIAGVSGLWALYTYTYVGTTLTGCVHLLRYIFSVISSNLMTIKTSIHILFCVINGAYCYLSYVQIWTSWEHYLFCSAQLCLGLRFLCWAWLRECHKSLNGISFCHRYAPTCFFIYIATLIPAFYAMVAAQYDITSIAQSQ